MFFTFFILLTNLFFAIFLLYSKGAFLLLKIKPLPILQAPPFLIILQNQMVVSFIRLQQVIWFYGVTILPTTEREKEAHCFLSLAMRGLNVIISSIILQRAEVELCFLCRPQWN